MEGYPTYGTKSGIVYDVLGWGALIPTLYLFASPFGTVKKISSDKTTGSYSDMPYVTSVMNCTLWVLCLSLTEGELQPLVTNIIGSVLEVVWVFVFFVYHDNGRRLHLLIKCAVAATIVGALYVLAHLSGDAQSFLGEACIVLNVMMYASPLSVMFLVIRTRSVEYMPLPLSVATFLTTVFWAAYALWVGDGHIGWPNNIGIFLSVAQLVLYAKYSGSARSVPVCGQLLDSNSNHHRQESRPADAVAAAERDVRNDV